MAGASVHPIIQKQAGSCIGSTQIHQCSTITCWTIAHSYAHIAKETFSQSQFLFHIFNNVYEKQCLYLILVPERSACGVHVPERGGVVEAGVRAHHDADDPGHGGRVQLGGHEAGQVAAACLLLGRELEGGRTDM